MCGLGVFRICLSLPSLLDFRERSAEAAALGNRTRAALDASGTGVRTAVRRALARPFQGLEEPRSGWSEF